MFAITISIIAIAISIYSIITYNILIRELNIKIKQLDKKIKELDQYSNRPSVFINEDIFSYEFDPNNTSLTMDKPKGE